MKKLIAAIVIASVGAALADQSYVVYDYKASIKRLEISAKYNKKIGVTQKFSVKSDTIQGYVTIPVCENCTKKPEDIDTALGINREDNGDPQTGEDKDAPMGFAYLTLKSSKKLFDDPTYIRTPIMADIGVFGADQIVNEDDADTEADKIVDEKKINKAWMALDFPIPAEELATGTLKAKKGLEQDLELGFLGLGNVGVDDQRVEVQNTGFGTAKTLPGSSSFCGGKGSACLTVQTISGTLVGYPLHAGACDNTPMWNLCQVVNDDGEFDYEQTKNAVISGTWSLKYNKSLTDKYANDKEAAILDKIDGVVYVIDETGTVVGEK